MRGRYLYDTVKKGFKDDLGVKTISPAVCSWDSKGEKGMTIL